jgi:hypothetical protein
VARKEGKNETAERVEMRRMRVEMLVSREKSKDFRECPLHSQTTTAAV